MTILIVDDEDLARQKIRHFLTEHPDCIIHAECANGFQAVEACCEALPDVIFLDVQMPELDGFETLRMIREAHGNQDNHASMPLVVFVTAYDHYALKAFEAHAADYLLKPFDYDRFEAMLRRVGERLHDQNARRAHEDLLAQLKSEREITSYTERFAFKTRGRIYFVNVGEVDWIEADKNYALFHVANLAHVLRTTFGELEQMLDPNRFVRVHRSAIVPTANIKEIVKRSDRSYAVALHSGSVLDVGAGYRERVFAALGLVQPKEDDE
jgi:two-component system, LytTR family, response regulator